MIPGFLSHLCISPQSRKSMTIGFLHEVTNVEIRCSHAIPMYAQRKVERTNGSENKSEETREKEDNLLLPLFSKISLFPLLTTEV